MPRFVLTYMPLVATFILPLYATPSQAETLVSRDADERVVVGFKAAAGGAQAALPAGWTSTPLGKGPLAGTDVFMVFIERHRYADPDGKPKYQGRFRGVALAVPAQQDGTENRGTFVTHVYISDGEINPYSNTVLSKVTREISSKGVDNGPALTRQEWDIEPATGGEIELEIEYENGMPGQRASESNVHSNVKPDFYRIYRYNQFADLLRSGPAGVDRVKDLEIDISVDALKPMFDGSEEVIGILSLPWYWRETWLP